MVIMNIVKTLLYKYGVQVLCILLEFFGIIIFFNFLAHYATILWVLLYITTYIAFIAVVGKNINPEFKIPWISIILLFPPVGTLIYGLFFSRNMSNKEIKHLRKLEVEYKEVINNKDYNKENIDILTQGKMNNLLHDDYLAEVYKNTTSKYYALGDDMFVDMINDLKNAKEFIFLEYFIVEKGIMWDSILEILINKVKKGIEVRMLYDDFGCGTILPRNYDKLLQEMGIKCYKFNRFSPQASCIHNNRDHRKILVIDGKIGYTGGINLADEYINKIEKHGHWKDGGIRLEGEALNGLTRLFLINFDVNNKTITDYKKYKKDYKVDDEGIYIPFGSGGHEIGKQVAKGLGIQFYDEEILKAATEKIGIDKKILEKADEVRENKLLYRAVYEGESSMYGESVNDTLYELQKETILKLASEQDCVIVGRCAGDILRENTNYSVVKIFISAPLEYRMERKKMSEKEIRKMDKHRKSYYEYHTGKDWNHPSNYDATFNTGTMGIERIVNVLVESFEKIKR